MKQWFSVNNLKNNEQGMALVTVLMVFVVVSILGLSLMGLAASNMKMSTGERTNQSAFYIAESGVTYMMSEVTEEVQEAYENAESRNQFYTDVQAGFTANNFFAERDLTSFEENFGQQPNAKVKIEAVDIPNGKYKIISTGTIDNRTRTVEQEFKIRWSVSFPNTAVFVDNTIEVASGSAIINGSIGTNSIANDAIKLHDTGSIETNASIIVGPGAPNGGNDVVSLANYTNIHVLEEEISLEMKPFKEKPIISYPTTLGTTSVDSNGDLTITSDTTINNLPNQIVLNNLTIDNNKTLNIDVGMNNVDLYVNNLVVNNNSLLNVRGTGTLSIYVDGLLTFNNAGIKQEAGLNNNLIIYLRGSNDPNTPKTIEASASATGINCNIFAEDANLKLTGGNFHGRFVTGGDVVIQGNNVIQGSLISDNLLMGGQSSITFIPENATLPLPDFEINPLDPEPVREK